MTSYSYVVEVVTQSGPLTEVTPSEPMGLDAATAFAHAAIGAGATSAEIWCEQTDQMIECVGPRVFV